ncbi:MAG: DNA-directed RNA polymerase subunit alpha [Clostridiales bacterium]|nr:DNA-directed RNA polymerase subunit alpha [Clostridiales bacterium]
MTELQKPKIEIVEVDTATNYLRFTVEPLERGFGLTLGNALRRVMLWYVPGVAVKAIKIDGVLHEFSTIPGVKEDVVDIILNIKELAIKTDGDVPRTLKINVKGPCELTGADIQTDMDVEILNPDHHIATLNEDAELYMELTIDRGRGFEVAAKKTEDTIGLIPIDAVYSPIKKVNFKVEDLRVGNRTDFDKLTFEVWTNGAIEPEEATGISAQILCDYFSLFTNISVVSDNTESNNVRIDDGSMRKYDTPIEDLELSVRSYNCLKRAGINTIGELVQKSEEDMIKVRNLGKKSLEEVELKLRSLGMALKPSDE